MKKIKNYIIHGLVWLGSCLPVVFYFYGCFQIAPMVYIKFYNKFEVIGATHAENLSASLTLFALLIGLFMVYGTNNREHSDAIIAALEKDKQAKIAKEMEGTN